MRLILLVCAMCCGVAAAQEPAACGALKKRLSALNVDMAMEAAQAEFDDSAPRETNRQLRVLNMNTSRSQVLMQMQSNGCRLPAEPFPDGLYALKARDCAHLKKFGDAAVAPKNACDLSHWDTPPRE